MKEIRGTVIVKAVGSTTLVKGKDVCKSNWEI